jgi:hypothetical protein
MVEITTRAGTITTTTTLITIAITTTEEIITTISIRTRTTWREKNLAICQLKYINNSKHQSCKKKKPAKISPISASPFLRGERHGLRPASIFRSAN